MKTKLTDFDRGMFPKGTIFRALGNPTLLCFVPESLVLQWDEPTYLDDKWGVINARANPHALGSHVLPDLTKPVSTPPPTFLSRLEDQFPVSVLNLEHTPPTVPIVDDHTSPTDPVVGKPQIYVGEQLQEAASAAWGTRDTKKTGIGSRLQGYYSSRM